MYGHYSAVSSTSVYQQPNCRCASVRKRLGSRRTDTFRPYALQAPLPPCCTAPFPRRTDTAPYRPATHAEHTLHVCVTLQASKRGDGRRLHTQVLRNLVALHTRKVYTRKVLTEDHRTSP